jgi:cytochrome c-type biogenesis protein CcmI
MIGFLLTVVAMAAVATLYLFWPSSRKAAQARGGATEQDRDRSNLMIMRDQIKELDNDYQTGVIGKAEYDESLAELERRMLEETEHLVPGNGAKKQTKQTAPMAPQTGRKAIWSVASFLALLLVGSALYWVIGTPDVVFSPRLLVAEVQQQETDDAHSFTPEQFETMLQEFAARMEQEPDNVEGWVMLARSYAQTGKYQESVAAFEKIIDKVDDDPNVFVDYADILAYVQKGKLEGRPIEMVNRALKLDPINWKALGLAGTYAFDQGNYREAELQWMKMKGSLPAGSEMSRMMDASIEEARKRQNAETEPPSATAPVQEKANIGNARVTGTVSLAAELQEKVSPEDKMMIYAHRAGGATTPIAFMTATVADLPLSFVLDESKAMIKTETLASVDKVIVVARVSKSREANAQLGDLEGASEPVNVGATDLHIVIDHEI